VSPARLNALGRIVDDVAHAGDFSGVVQVERDGSTELLAAYGYAHRAHEIPNRDSTQFAIASGTKGFTALVVVSLVEDGTLALETPARSVLGTDLPLVDDGVTIEHLLAHRSGIGDYLDEEMLASGDVDDVMLSTPPGDLEHTEQYLRVLGGHPQKFAPGERFSYCNGGYVVLALIAERASGIPFDDLVYGRVCEPAAMDATAFLRSDALPATAAVGYLAGDPARTNVFHLPVRGNGDGGVYTTARDVHRFWDAFTAGRIVADEWVAAMLRPLSDVPEHHMRYGLGFWLHPTADRVMLEGFDAGVSFRTVHDPGTRTTHTVLSNTSAGAWPITRALDDALFPAPADDQ
jgi:CubicO group peptidase (beta-lactamase class C family)